MQRFSILDPTKTGRQAKDLENDLRHLVVGQEEAIDQIVNAYQAIWRDYLQPAGRSETFCSWAHGLRKDSHRGGNGTGPP